VLTRYRPRPRPDVPVREATSDGLFAYGTLQFPDVLQALLRRAPKREEARAPGWRAAPLADRPYPGLVREPGATAAGIVLSGLTSAEWALLDAFEGEFYRLELVDVGTGQPVQAYIWLSPEDVLAGTWDPHRFVQRELAGYVSRCRRWREYYVDAGS